MKMDNIFDAFIFLKIHWFCMKETCRQINTNFWMKLDIELKLSGVPTLPVGERKIGGWMTIFGLNCEKKVKLPVQS